jgi:AcrR family transcriptional regulator
MEPARKGGTNGPQAARRSREEVSDALTDATVALFAERGSGRVTVRDIAERAGVNATLVHRYFGSKQGLMRAAMERSQKRLASRIEEMPDVLDGAAAVVHATLQEREFIATLTRATLDGVFEGIPIDNPAMARLVERFEAEAVRRGAGRHEPRVVVACLSAATVGFALLGDFIRHGTGLADRPEEDVEALLVAVLKDVASLAFRA